jgi:hypothetical protein
MTGPSVSPQAVEAVRQLTSQLTRMSARIAQLERNQRASQLGNSSIDNGALTINDADGSPQLVIGRQPDGSFAHAAVGTVNIPLAPSDPLCNPGIGGVYVVWDGLMNDGSAPLADSAGVQVHLSAAEGFTPGPATLQGVLASSGIFGVGGLVPGSDYFVRLVAVNAAGMVGSPSNEVPASADSVGNNIAGGEITGSQIATGTVTGDNIAAGTIAAEHLVAGIIVAGIIDGSVVNAPTIVSSTILGYAVEPPRGPVSWTFEDGTDLWQSVNGTLSTDPTFATDGAQSLLLTANGAGVPFGASPPFAVPVVPGDPVAVSMDVFCAAGLNNVFVGIQFWDAALANLLAETDCPDTVFTAGQQMTLTSGDNAPAEGYAIAVFGDHNAADPAGTLINVDNVMISGNLAFAASAFGGTDLVDNPYDQGIQIIGVPGLVEAFSVVDPWSKNTLASIDGQGNIVGQSLVVVDDVITGGSSIVNDILPSYPQGFVNRGWIDVAGANWPSTNGLGATETALFELDVVVPAGRTYEVLLSGYRAAFSAAGTATVNIHYTTDGSTPTTASPVFVNLVFAQSAAVMIPDWSGFYNNVSGSDTTLRLLVSGFASAGTWNLHPSGGNVNALMLSVLDAGDIDAAAINNNAVVFVSGGTSGGSSKQNLTTTWKSSSTYSYEGTAGDSNPNPGFSPGALLNHNGNAFQGDDQLGDKGNCSTFIQWPGAVTSALSGATVNHVWITLNNNHSWFDSGIVWSLGFTTATPGGGSRPAITNPSIASLNSAEGATHTYEISNISSAFGTALKNGNPFVLYHAGSSRTYYGYAAGAGQGGPPTIKVAYTK